MRVKTLKFVKFPSLPLWLFLALLFFPVLISCRAQESYLPFSSEEGIQLLKESRTGRSNKEGLFKPGEEVFETGLFNLPVPRNLKPGDTFYVTYSSAGFSELEIITSQNTLQLADLPSTGGKLRKMYIPLPAGKEISGFSFKTADPGTEVYETGVERDPSGIQILKGSEITGSSFVLNPSKKREGFVSIDFPGLSGRLLDSARQFRLVLSYKPEREDLGMPADVYIQGYRNTKADPQSAERTVYSFTLLPSVETQRVDLYSSTLPVLPDRVEVPEIALHSFFQLFLEPVVPENPHPFHPLQADLQSILEYPREYWRREDFEIFSWSLFPKVLVMDFGDLALQSAFLKRLAFFVEKKNFAGTIPEEERIRNLHGWNAHDYQARDLAEFFRKARAEGILLNPSEELLLEILLVNGIVLEREGEIFAGEGAILSMSQASSARLRWTFLVHESFHGIFFIDPVYQRRVAEIWNSLTDEERWFWKVFLDSKDYDTRNPYLLINEFQAYLLQQPLEQVDSYYWDYIFPNMKHNFPRLKAELDLFEEKYPDTFRNSAEKLELLLAELYGLSVLNILSRTPLREAPDPPGIRRRD